MGARPTIARDSTTKRHFFVVGHGPLVLFQVVIYHAVATTQYLQRHFGAPHPNAKNQLQQREVCKPHRIINLAITTQQRNLTIDQKSISSSTGAAPSLECSHRLTAISQRNISFSFFVTVTSSFRHRLRMCLPHYKVYSGCRHEVFTHMEACPHKPKCWYEYTEVKVEGDCSKCVDEKKDEPTPEERRARGQTLDLGLW